MDTALDWVVRNGGLDAAAVYPFAGALADCTSAMHVPVQSIVSYQHVTNTGDVETIYNLIRVRGPQQ